ncbi:MAG: hypothetical protein J6D37_09330 [Clostridia bacterium]|nr:hypothetical protein [Clostridia bacterium]
MNNQEKKEMQSAADALSATVTDGAKSTVEYKQSYCEGSVGEAGSYRVNQRTGFLTFEKELFALGGEKMPMCMKLVYRQEEAEASDMQTGFPRGWKLNYQQYIYAKEGKYVYVDGDYQRHVFAPITAGSLYYDTDRTGLLLRITNGVVKITDDRTLECTFTSGKLTEIKQTKGTSEMKTTIAYNGKNMTITDGMGRDATVTVSGTSISIVKPDKKTITLTIANGNLTSLKAVAHASGENTSTFAYSGNKLTSVSSYSGESVEFTQGTTNVSKIVDKIGGQIVRVRTLKRKEKSVEVATRNFSESAPPITMNYDFNEDGECTASMEIDGTLKTSTAFAAYMDADYQRYTVRDNRTAEIVSSEIFGEFIRDTDFQDTTPRSIQLNGGEEAMFFMDAYLKGIDEGQQLSTPVTVDVSLIQNMETVGELHLSLAEGGTQLKACRVPKLTSGATFIFEFHARDIPVNVPLMVNGVGVTKAIRSATLDCVDIDVPNAESYKIGDKTWRVVQSYKLAGVSDCVKVTVADYNRTLRNYKKNNSSYIAWYNGMTKAALKSGAVSYTVNDTTQTIGFSYGTVSLQGEIVTSDYVQYTDTDATEIKCTQKGTSSRTETSTFNKYDLTTSVTDGTKTASYDYNVYGCLLSEQISADNSTMYFKSDYSTDGKFLVEERDYAGAEANVQKYAYTENTGNLSSDTDPVFLTTNYAYAADNEALSKLSATVESKENSNAFTYDSKKRISAIAHNGFSYTFGYGSRNEITSVAAGGTTLLTKTYTYNISDGSYTVSDKYGNNQSISKAYDRYGRLLSDGEILYTYGVKENTSGVQPINAILLKKVDNGLTTEYNYNELEQLSSWDRSDDVHYTRGYDKQGRVTSESVSFGTAPQNTVLSNAYTHDDITHPGTLSSESASIGNLNYKTFYDYDALGRLSSKTLKVGNVGVKNDALMQVLKYTTAYVGVSVADVPANTTERLQMWRCVWSTSTFTDWYTQDKNGNILSVLGEGGNNSASYEYDKLSRLTRENNLALNKTYTYTYDAGGNITSKKEYAYTTGALGSVQKTYPYGYRTSGWKDQLLSWNGKSFAYDNAGNPTTYKGESMTWTRGRLLSGYDHSGVNFDYFYSGNGERKTKSYAVSDTNFETTNYYYEGGRLLREERITQDGTKNIYYQYDETGVIGFIYNGYQYYYRKNAQGDILSVHCGTDLHAMYTYDAWGNCTISFDAAGIGALNPFRYRGYYLDRETGLYYLMTRYYDPEIGRFVNANSLARLNPKALNGCNLYAYCGENPVMRKVAVNLGRGNLPAFSHSSSSGQGNHPSETVVPASPSFWQAIGTWFANTFGAYVDLSKNEVLSSKDYFFFGHEVGITVEETIGDNTKPISVFVHNASEWFRFWEYKAGISLNFGEFHASLGLWFNEWEASIGWGNSSFDIVYGLNKMGIGTSHINDEGDKAYNQTFIRPIPVVAVIVIVCLAFGALPVLVSALA